MTTATPSRDDLMSLRERTQLALAEHQGIRVAALPSEEGDSNPFMQGKGLSMPTKRQIPKDHSFDPKQLKPIVKTLWALSVSLGHALTAHRQFSRLKSISFSPDGLVGGRGYVMGVKDVRQALHEATENISTICDALYDEVNAPHWKGKLGELEKNDEDFMKLLEDAKGYMDDPEGEAEEDMDEVEHRPASWSRFKKDDDENRGSKIPDGGDKGNESQGPNPIRNDRPEMKQSSMKYSYDRTANSSVDPGSLPGPRVDHLDRGLQTGPEGSYNRDEPRVTDEHGHDGPRQYAYQSEWDNNLSDRTAIAPDPVAESAIPNDSETPEPVVQDFGLGYGAHGQGTDYPNPSGSEGSGTVWGPKSELPDLPAARGSGTGLEGVERSTNNGIPMVAKKTARLLTRADLLAELESSGILPNDDEPPVARSDYYEGPKGNNNVVHFSEAELPGDGAGGTYDSGKDLMNDAVKVEQVSQPYVKWDDTTHQMKPDYTYQRDPIQGPYVKQ